MHFHVHIHHHGDDLADTLRKAVAPLFQSLENRLMSALDDKVAELAAHVDAAVARVAALDVAKQAENDDLKAKLAALQADVDAGGGTPETFAAIQAIEDKIDALDPANVTPPPAPAPDAPAPAPDAPVVDPAPAPDAPAPDAPAPTA